MPNAIKMQELRHMRGKLQGAKQKSQNLRKPAENMMKKQQDTERNAKSITSG